MDNAARVEKLVDVYLSWLLSTDQDAGWHQPKDMAIGMPGGGGCSRPESKMLAEVKWLVEPHALLPLAQHLISRLKPKHRVPLIVHHRYTGAVNPLTGRYWTAQTIAEQIGMTADQYRQLRRRAQGKLSLWLVEIDLQYIEKNMDAY